jgi:hypothetical protein
MNQTPAELAKAFAAEHGFVIGTIPALKRYTVRLLNRETGVAMLGEPIAEVGGYPAALNAMKRYVEAKEVVTAAVRSPDGVALGFAQVERGEIEKARAMGAEVVEVPYDYEQKPIKTDFVNAQFAEVAKRTNIPEQLLRAQHATEEAVKAVELPKQPQRKPYVVTTQVNGEWIPVVGAAFESYGEAIRYCRQIRNSKLGAASRPRRVEYRA